MCNSKYNMVKTILWIILFANFTVAGIKIIIGIICNSQSVIADVIHSFADGASNIVGLIGIWLAFKPRDEKHPYGHEKFEILASLFIGIMLAILAIRIISSAIFSFKNSTAISITFIETILMIFTIVVNSVVAFTEYRCGKKLNSIILITDSLHTRGDIMISCAVLFGLIAIKIGFPIWIDSLMSVIVAIAVIVSAWKIIKNCVDVLVDSTAIDSNEIEKLLVSIPGVENVHSIRSRGELSHIFIDLHIIVNPDENIINSHILSHKLESILKEHFGINTEVNIHIEPNDGMHENRINND